MTSPAYLVEGDLEQKFIQNVCKTSPVQKICLNGKTVGIEAIAKRVGTQGRLLQRRNSPLIVVFDREMRDESSEEIECQFRSAMIAEDITVPIIVGIPDRHIENWILSDYQRFAEANGIPIPSTPPDTEGNRGKFYLKSYLPEAKKKYVETVDGVAWLKSARPKIMKENSPSFKRFYDALRQLDCWWLQQQDMMI